MPEDPNVGLCISCKHARRITSDRGSVFYLCTLSAVDPRFPKYPTLPVMACAGYEERAGGPTVSERKAE
jgi:hypothetical protein